MEVDVQESFFFPEGNVTPDWRGFKLIVPTVAVGNVAQLSMDLLISSLLREKKLARSGRICSPLVRPVIGPNAYDIFSPNVTTSMEVYHSVKLKMVLIQVRSPPFAEGKKQFIEQLSEWITAQRFEEVVILSSSFSQFISSPDIQGSGLLKYLASPQVPFFFDVQPVPKVDAYSYRPDSERGVIKLPGCGIAMKLFESLTSKEASLRVILLIRYCSEGDNTPDAFDLSQWIIKNVILDSTLKLSTPISWNKFFGEGFPSALF
jgi:proteasome assembly chaperone 2